MSRHSNTRHNTRLSNTELSATAQLAFYAPLRSPLIIYNPKFNLSWKTHKWLPVKKVSRKSRKANQGKQVKWSQFLKKKTRRQLSATAQLAFYAPLRRSLIIYTPKFNLCWKTHNMASGEKDQQYYKWYNF